tara:strand:+ start:142 stop:465 length:324 start_codon:yes stop_codon:yes gene_type:complete
MRKYDIAVAIERWCKKNDAISDTRIYFNGKAWNYNSSGEKTVLEDIKGSDYFEYADDDTISMSFEGGLYHIMNYGPYELKEEFEDIFTPFGYYCELGHAWNLSLCKI